MTHASTARPRPPYRVLVCDDATVMRRTLRQFLEGTSEFHIVGEAAGGLESIDKAIQLKPDLVLMDVRMPDLDGIEATRRILLAVPGVRVLAFSSDSAPETVDLMLEAGADGYLVKGADPDELVRAARKVLAGKRYLDVAVP